MLKPNRLYVYSLISRILPETKFFAFKARLLRWCGAEIGSDVRICSSAIILGTGELRIGNDVWIGPKVFICSGSKIEIGCHIDIAPQVLINTGTHEIDCAGSHVAGKGQQGDIYIGNGVWLCVRAVILSGVTVGEKAVIAAGAVLCSDADAYGVYGGVPAKLIKNMGGARG